MTSDQSSTPVPAADTNWLAAYLYYTGSWETFITKAVEPFVQQVLQNQWAEQFFFIRYWEKGPHIRLRFKGNSSTLENKIKPELINHFSAYFAAHPSDRPTPEWLKELPEADQWFPNNSIQFITYEPETERYGGEPGLLIAEQQFQSSSQAVFAILNKSQAWEYSRALGVAIQLHLGFAFAVGMDVQEAAHFFSFVFKNWSPHSYQSYDEPVLSDQLQERQTEVLQAFQTTFNHQKSTLLPLFQTIWEALEEDTEFEEDWYNQWIMDMKAVNQAIWKLQTEGKLTIPPWPAIEPSNFSVAQQERWILYDSYVHMTNNRLGILNRDEGYLGYLLKEGLSEMVLS
jgi:thiopeptide-type bacteriocin biosynthesis protein